MEKISVIIPTLNEEENIKRLIKRIANAVSAQKIVYEIIIVDDHSTDDTKKIVSALSSEYPIRFFTKEGKRGKAYSLMQGFSKAKYDTFVMIDGDLQYPPEELPKMIKKIKGGADVVVTLRKKYNDSLVRRILSKGFKFLFSKCLFALDHDVQSGLKVFTREVYETVKFAPKSSWTFDLEFLYQAHEAGFDIQDHNITFEPRRKGKSKIGFLRAVFEIGYHALLLRLQEIQPKQVVSTEKNSMFGAGIRHKKYKYITHTTLSHKHSAIHTMVRWQKLIIAVCVLFLCLGLLLNPLLTLQGFVAILSFVYFADVIFNLYLITKSLRVPQEITFSNEQIKSLNEARLPIYTILCPLYKEAHVIPQFIKSIQALDWPKEKLDVILLLEEDDDQTIQAVKQMQIPSFFRVLIVPHSFPKTKPKACNYGLAHARGEYLVIFDAEDIPENMQLKKAYLGFQSVGKDVVCLQAKLNYYNPYQNLLTRLFTAEYSLWFDVTLTGLQSIGTAMPLGGTSNHFRVKDLAMLEGWDPFNVTEDADLGIRLFKKGYKTAIIDSLTLEEANSKLGNWVRQRSRWIKGYMQTYLVHTREMFGFTKKQKRHSLIFHLVIGGKIAFILINPLLWIATFSYFAMYALVGSAIELLFPTYVFYMAAISLIFGNFLFLYYYMIGCAKRGQWSLIKFVYLVPFYWLSISVAGVVALYQLIFKPHYWEKTIHGFHFEKDFKNMLSQKIIEAEESSVGIPLPTRLKDRLRGLISSKKVYISGAALIAATMAANILNFIFSVYLGRTLQLEEFGELSLFTSLLYLLSIPLGSFSATISHNIAYLYGKQSKAHAQGYLQYIFKKSIWYGIALSILWALVSPLLSHFFHTESFTILLFFAPLWFVSVASANFSGYMAGTLSFGGKGIVLLTESIARLSLAFFLVAVGLSDYVFLSIVLSISISVFVSWLLTRSKQIKEITTVEKKFNVLFFITSAFNGLSLITFLTLDVVLVKHFLTPAAAGQYGLLSLIGKMTYFLGSLFIPFMIPLVSHNEGAKKHSKNTFVLLFITTIVFCIGSFVFLGLLGRFFVPVIFGPKTIAIVPLLIPYVLSMAIFTITQPIVNFFQAKENYSFAVASFIVAIMQILLTTLFHKDLQQVVFVMLLTSCVNFLLMALLYFTKSRQWVFYENLIDFLELFIASKKNKKSTKTTPVKRILVFNWRDTKHRWAGGAETYIHEIAKRWVQKGHHVTIFSGNDGYHSRNEIVDGIRVIRRGGFYMVYFWAFLYYMIKFKGQYDVIIDSENGIPFFTPLYVRKPIFLLIHHVHQEVFRRSLTWPLSTIALLLEAKLMPLVYRNVQVITVSPSSKEEILRYKLTTKDPIIIYNGVDMNVFKPGVKQTKPLILYLGRLQQYKSLHIFIEAAKKVIAINDTVAFVIAGEGEEKKQLQKLTHQLEMSKYIKFLGRISDEEKAALYQRAWVFINPSFMEGWGITTLEANACGTPAIASDVPGLQDSVKHNQTGILTPYGDSDQLAMAIQNIITDTKLRTQLSENAIQWARRFDWHVSSETFYDIIESHLQTLKPNAVQTTVLAENNKQDYDK